MCCTLMLLFARPVAPASRGLMSPAPAPTPPAAPAVSPATPIAPARAPTTRHFTWNVEYILWAPDCTQHGMIGINGSFPGPTITANAGDRIVVVVNNHLDTEGVVVHWHGIRQIGTPWADGTASISQCAIDPGESFTYDFTVDKAGTFFYHGHFGMQRAAGLYGSLIVNVPEGKKEPFHYDGELNMLLSDWYHEAVYAQAAGLERKDKHFQWIGEPQAILINGKGQYDCTLGDVGEFQKGIRHNAEKCDARKGKQVEDACDKDCSADANKVEADCKAKECSGKQGEEMKACDGECGMKAAKEKAVCDDEKKVSCEVIMKSECGPFCRKTQCGPVVFDVEPGKTYRLRIASTTSLASLNVQVQGHKMVMVEADGNYVDPFVVDDVDIYSGESYSILLKTNPNSKGSFWISVGVRGRKPKTLPALAILKYSNTGSSVLLPTTMPPETPDWESVNRSKTFTYNIKAAAGTEKPVESTDPPMVLLNTQDVVEDHIKWAINHVSLGLPSTPYLGAYLYGMEEDVFNTTEAPHTFNSKYNISKPPEEQDPDGKTPTTVSNQVYRFPNGRVMDVVIQNANMRKRDTSEVHPWHLHGHDFWVMGYGEGRYEHERDAKTLNMVNPPLRNTVVVFPFGWTALRFVADNPGVWAFHCHIEPHLHMGMGVIFAEGVEKLHTLKEAPKEAFMCGVVSSRGTPAKPLAPAGSPSP
ncbi:hypothetical protein QOZ80_UnG0729060 [Eleusine coracana subsp. coracana]|uniref:L-ascorbate oxidase n=2 Tax=Eleusine coracana subsp. coracana TaxID=191504 RepID=A0AAV9FYH1_ELECO|nr:hypothetical protein QOZ80_UnG0729060 [Eleusine coracana subsp. coracana]